MENQKFMQPMEHLHMLLDTEVPSMRWDGVTPIADWQKCAREKLAALVGLDEIEPYRTDARLEIEFDRICEEEGFREIRFRFYSEENVSVPCHLVQPLGAEKPLPVVICLQGHSKGMHISLGRPIYPGDEETCHGGDRDFCVRAVKEGVCAIAMEQRCFGESGGTEKGPDCRQAAMRAILLGRTLIGERVWDIMRLIDVIEQNFTEICDKDKIMCLGNSGGGTATVYASALETRIRFAVPSCAVCRFADSIGAMMHCECNFVPGIAKVFDMGELCGLIAPRKLVVVSGHNDPIFPLDGAKACVAEAKRIYTALGAPDNIAHVVGDGAHRFYAGDAWPVIHAMAD
ncbi:MAG: acetylxylan esterase [Clostridia bacterium]|nr:acetylxylan esterase [Clostridia bacterium]